MPPKKRNTGTPQNKEVKPSVKSSASPEKKENAELSIKKHKDKDEDFVALCKTLQVTDSVCDHAWTFWKSVQKSMEDDPDTQRRMWGACLYVTVSDMDVTSFTLTQVQKAVDLNVKQFLSLVRKLDVNLDTISNRVSSVLTRLEKRYDVTLALYQRFEKTCMKIFSADSVKEKEMQQICWTMFLLAKGRALQMEDDLVMAFQLLLCVLKFLIKRCPADALQPLYPKPRARQREPLAATRAKPRPAPPEPELDVQLLDALCKENDCNLEEVKNLYQTSFCGFLESMDLLRSQDLPQASELSRHYEEDYLRTREFDGRLFLDGDETNCTVDPTEGVQKRVETLGQMFCQRYCQAVGPRCAVLGRQEEKRLSVQNFSKLLNDSTFHTSLLACALEVVMATYGGHGVKTGGYHTHQHHNSAGGGNTTTTEPTDTDLCFPWILDVFQLAAFDIYKVIESFIKAEPSLSKDIVKHLEVCEHLIMETLAWRTGSHLFVLLKQAQEEGSAEQLETPAAFNQPLQHNHTAADLYLSPVRPEHRVLLPPERPGTPTGQAPLPQAQAPQHQRSNSLSLFYKKLYRLAYTRLKMLCSYLLSSNPELEPVMWTLLQSTLQHQYELMRDRHLDQVKSVDLRFKIIVSAYKNMPNANQETFKNVLISEGSELSPPYHDSIIVFYNQVFMQKLKVNILQYASTRPPTLSPIPHIPHSPYKFPSSPLRVPGSSNVYQSNRFQKINQMVNSSDFSLKRTLDTGSTPKPLKRLRFDMDGQDEVDGRLHEVPHAGAEAEGGVREGVRGARPCSCCSSSSPAMKDICSGSFYMLDACAWL
ncbi:hypothetical protein CRUP_037577 [Coryphaenoides rupestris]|nr:hypothetical protein CRUP_037577 [Coryphaenoides rupestris]